MKWLVELANEVHRALGQLVGPAFHAAHTMSGALAVVSAGDAKLFQATAHYNMAGDHVEKQLMAALFGWTNKDGRPFFLPAECSVYLYVFDSPCQACVTVLGRNHQWMWVRKNLTVKWYLGFTRYYLAGADCYATPMAANQAYATTSWRVINPAAAPPAAPPAAAAVAAAGGGGGGGGGAAAAAVAAHAGGGGGGGGGPAVAVAAPPLGVVVPAKRRHPS